MAFQQSQQSQPVLNLQQPGYIQSPPPGHFGTGGAFGYIPPTSPSPPPWATEILDEIKQIKQKLQSVEKLEKNLNSINSKVCDIENKMKSPRNRKGM